MLPRPPTRPARPADDACPCGGGTYDACCGPLLRAERLAASPEELMRSRYSAYALGVTEHVWRTWHPRTRPPQVTDDPTVTWRGLQVLAAEGDEVEFVATFDGPDGPGRLHERSAFEQRGGRWVYRGPAGTEGSDT